MERGPGTGRERSRAAEGERGRHGGPDGRAGESTDEAAGRGRPRRPKRKGRSGSRGQAARAVMRQPVLSPIYPVWGRGGGRGWVITAGAWGEAGPAGGAGRERETRARPQIRRGYPLNLSISLSGGKETNKDSPSNGE